MGLLLDQVHWTKWVNKEAYIVVNSLDYKHTLSGLQDGQHFPEC